MISDGLYDWFKPWANQPIHRREPSYQTFKKQLTRHLVDILYETVPQAKGRVEFSFLGTPLAEEHFLGSFNAGSYGTRCNVDLFASKNRAWVTRPETKVPGLFLAGSDAFLPSVTGAMYGGVLGAFSALGPGKGVRMLCDIVGAAARRICDEEKVSKARAWMIAARRFMS